MLKFLLLLCLSWHVLGNSVTVPVNKLVDKTMVVVDGIIKAAKRDIIELDNLHITSFYPPLLFSRPFEVRCEKGRIEALDSLRRKGNVIATTKGDTTTVRGHLEFGRLSASYRNCHFDLPPFIMDQHYKAEITSSTISFRASYNRSSTGCSSSLDNIELRDLGDFYIERKNDWRNIFGGHFLIGQLTPFIRREMILIFDDLIRKEIPNMNLCNLFKLVKAIE